MTGVTRDCGGRTPMGEGPPWHPVERVLHGVDVPGRLIPGKDIANSGGTQRWSLPERTGCIAWMPDGRLVGALASGLFRLVITEGQLQIARSAATRPGPGIRFNDGRVDPCGNLVAGSMADPDDGTPNGCLCRFDDTAIGEPLITGLRMQDGAAWSPYGATMHLSDPHPAVQAAWALDHDRKIGALTNRRAFIDMRRNPGRPDGTAVDKEGFCRVAANGGGRIMRFSPGGRLAREPELPSARPARCTFGGANLGALSITTMGRDPATCGWSREAGDGCLPAIRPGVHGLPDHPCLHLPKSPHAAMTRQPE